MIGRLALVAASQLDELFEVWLFTPSKPEGIETASALTARTAGTLGRLPSRLPKR
jgi:hypothetical protein